VSTKTEVARVTEVTEAANLNVSAASETDTAVTQASKVSVTNVTLPIPSAVEVTQVTLCPTWGLLNKPIADQRSNPGNRSDPQNDECANSPNVGGYALQALGANAEEERSAIVEYDAGVPRARTC
jgi:hypothetical protein